ncbi:MAG: ribosome small subunit-dependent GTPase A, partial [Desulfobacterales bacterium]|nr:ribosome small subunit-dependent GTPase A [Desulfobacterales bacterium]
MDKKNTHIIDYTQDEPLMTLGWNARYQSEMEGCIKKGQYPARIVGQGKGYLRLSRGKDGFWARLAGRLKHQKNFPVVGDWVLVRDAFVTQILPRKNLLSRGAAGGHNQQEGAARASQGLAANLDGVFIVSGLDRDFNLRRLERYLTLVYNCDLTPIIVLTKADLREDPQSFARQVEEMAFGVPVHLVGMDDEAGLAPLEAYLTPGQTLCLMGSSGAGKSTLVNRLAGDELQEVGEVSEVLGKGMHTTTRRDLIRMPQGGMIVDNPGIREVAFWDASEGVEATFPDIEELARECRFANCTHAHEPGCRVIQA